MPATGHEALILLALLPLSLAADDTADRTAITEMFGTVAASLSEESPTAAMKWFDSAMPGHERL